MNVNDPRQIKACNDDPDCNVPYHQPGSAAGYPPFRKSKLKSCPEMSARIRGENPTVSATHFEGLCPYGTSKIALAVDPNEDYHFWRQDSNGLWSHKPGSLKVINKDASGRLIYDPSLCDRDFSDKSSELNYTEFCSFYCVPRTSPLFLKIGGRSFSIGESPLDPSVVASERKSRLRYPSTRRSSDRKRKGLQRNRTFRRDPRGSSLLE